MPRHGLGCGTLSVHSLPVFDLKILFFLYGNASWAQDELCLGSYSLTAAGNARESLMGS